MATVHINAPRTVEEACNVDYCPTCERPRRMFVAYYEWYGANVTCAGCGETWNDGYRAERPFCPGWRRTSREHAIRNLARIGVKA